MGQSLEHPSEPIIELFASGRAGHWEDGETMWFRLVAFGSDLDSFAKGDKVFA